MDVAIINYGMSNMHSIQSACSKSGLSSVITADAEQIMGARVAILPGVGAFGKAMEHLAESGLANCILRFVQSGKPFVGICLGLQILFETSEEFGEHKGLGIIKGTVKKFKVNTCKNNRYPVPQIGWNRICQNNSRWDNTLLCDNRGGDFMYFVHSYYVQPEDEKVVLATTTYGDLKYCSIIQHDNIFATQFHPEKSGEAGMKVYNNIYKLFQ